MSGERVAPDTREEFMKIADIHVNLIVDSVRVLGDEELALLISIAAREQRRLHDEPPEPSNVLKIWREQLAGEGVNSWLQ